VGPRGHEPSRSAQAANVPSPAKSTWIGGLSLINLIGGILHQWYIITWLGAGSEADAFFASMLPVFLVGFITTPLPYVLVPLLTIEAAERFSVAAWTFLSVVLSIFGLAAVGVAASASLWVPWMVPGFDTRTTELTAELVRVQALGLLFAGTSGVLVSIQQARQRFVWIEVSGILSGVVVMVLLIWGLPSFGVAFGSAALALRLGIQSLLLAGGLGTFRRPDWSITALREALQRLRPLILGAAYMKTDVLVDRLLASLGPPGSLALLANAQQIAAAAVRPLHAALVTPIVPTLTENAHVGNWNGFSVLVRNRAWLLWGIGLASMLGFLLVGEPLLALAFDFGRMEPDAIHRLWVFVLVLCGALAANLGSAVLISAYYALGNTVVPTVVGSSVYTAGLVLRIGLFYWMGVLGIAVAISVQAATNAVALAFTLFFRELSRRRKLAADYPASRGAPQSAWSIRAARLRSVTSVEP